MNRFRRLDHWMVEKVMEPAAHRLDWWFGVNRETLAKMLIVIWMAATIATACKDQGWYDWLFAGVALIATAFWFAVIITQPFGTKGTANPFKHFGLYVFMRNTSLLVFTPLDIVAIVSGNITPRLFGGIAFNIFLYVMACENAPPKPRTVPHHALSRGSA